MKSVSGKLFTGYKAVRLEDLPEEAWRIIVGEGSEGGEAAKLYAVVSWLYRCVDIRAGAVANMPWEIRRGETVVMTQDDDAPDKFTWLNDLAGLLYRTEAAVTLTGRAYWFRERNLLRTLAVRWLRPDSVRPQLDENGLNGFERRLANRSVPLEAEDLVYFWLPDPFVEIGPAEHYPGKAALKAAGVLNSMDDFLGGFFDRGLIKATLLKYTATISKEEGDRVKEWWNRVARGVRNAFSSQVIRGDFEPVVIGEGLKDLQNTALTAEQRESVCTALGVPQSKVTANAANYATKQGDDLMFIQDTIAPECRWLAATINRQLLGPMGLSLVFLPESLPIMQEDEAQRAQSLKILVEAGMSLEMAAAILGYDLPEGMELREPAAATPPQLLPFTGQQAADRIDGIDRMDEAERVEETRRFLRWAKKRANPDPEQFESVVLSREAKAALLEAASADDAPFRGDGSGPHDWQGYP